jgi:hypothetical protein
MEAEEQEDDILELSPEMPARAAANKNVVVKVADSLKNEKLAERYPHSFLKNMGWA